MVHSCVCLNGLQHIQPCLNNVASFVSVWDALKLAAVGCVTFTATTWLYTSIQNRLASGPIAKAAPVLSALGLYLASQCFMGIL